MPARILWWTVRPKICGPKSIVEYAVYGAVKQEEVVGVEKSFMHEAVTEVRRFRALVCTKSGRCGGASAFHALDLEFVMATFADVEIGTASRFVT